METNAKEGAESGQPKAETRFFNPREEIKWTEHRVPHWQQGEVYVFVTWRLGDSLPVETLRDWQLEKESWLRHHPQPWGEEIEAEFHKRFSSQMERWLDQGLGACVLRRPTNAGIVRDALLHWDGERYAMDSFVVMPNHVHVLFAPREPHALASIVKSWKGFSAREINRSMGARGSLWLDGYWDRLVRNEAHGWKCREYIRRNPEKAGLRDDECLVYVRERQTL